MSHTIFITHIVIKREYQYLLSERMKVDFLHHSCTIMHHNSPLIAPAKTKSITHHSRWGGGGPRGGTPTLQ